MPLVRTPSYMGDEQDDMEETTTQNDYRVNLDVFEGPLDLLLYLIKKNDLDIYDVPIAFILEEYVGYLDTLQDMNIDLAGEFLLLAAELAHIKSMMLLPDGGGEATEDEGADPRADLVRRLLEYQRYKEASEALLKRSLLGRDVFVRREGAEAEAEADGEMPIEASVYDLIGAFSTILKRIPQGKFHEVMVDRISVNERILQLVAIITKDATVSIRDLLPRPCTRYDVVITFLALLEMARLRAIRVYQGGMHDTIRVRGTLEQVSEEDMLRMVRLEDEAHGTAPPKE